MHQAFSLLFNVLPSRPIVLIRIAVNETHGTLGGSGREIPESSGGCIWWGHSHAG